MWIFRDEPEEQLKDREVSHLWIILAQVPKNILLFFRCFNRKNHAETKYIMGLDETHGRKEI